MTRCIFHCVFDRMRQTERILCRVVLPFSRLLAHSRAYSNRFHIASKGSDNDSFFDTNNFFFGFLFILHASRYVVHFIQRKRFTDFSTRRGKKGFFLQVHRRCVPYTQFHSRRRRWWGKRQCAHRPICVLWKATQNINNLLKLIVGVSEYTMSWRCALQFAAKNSQGAHSFVPLKRELNLEKKWGIFLNLSEHNFFSCVSFISRKTKHTRASFHFKAAQMEFIVTWH